MSGKGAGLAGWQIDHLWQLLSPLKDTVDKKHKIPLAEWTRLLDSTFKVAFSRPRLQSSSLFALRYLRCAQLAGCWSFRSPLLHRDSKAFFIPMLISMLSMLTVLMCVLWCCIASSSTLANVAIVDYPTVHEPDHLG